MRPIIGTKDRYHTLDGMRGLVALLVAGYHFSEACSWKLIPQGYLAVDFFFLLSGFVIALQYGGKLGDTLSVRRFMTLRIIRLYPLHMFGLAVGVLVFWTWKGPSHILPGSTAPTLLMNTLMLPTPFNALLFPFNGAQWSIFVEVVVNFIFALALYRLRSPMLLSVALIGVIGLLLTVHAPFFFDLGWAWPNLVGGLFRALFAFPTGMIVARLMRGRARDRSPIAILACIALLALMFAPVPRDLQVAYEFATVLVAFPMILLAGVRYEPFEWQMTPFAFLGDISYAVYAIHKPLVVIAIGIGPHTGMGLSLYLIGICALAALVSRFYDAPIRVAVSRMLRLRQTAAPQILAPKQGSEAR